MAQRSDARLGHRLHHVAGAVHIAPPHGAAAPAQRHLRRRVVDLVGAGKGGKERIVVEHVGAGPPEAVKLPAVGVSIEGEKPSHRIEPGGVAPHGHYAVSALQKFP